VIPREEGIALRVRGKVRFYATAMLEESPPLPLRPIRDGHTNEPGECRGTSLGCRIERFPAPSSSPA
jgi:hypothetical protein